MLKRQVYLNETNYVQLYSSEGGESNGNNCGEGCSGCNVGVGGGGGGSTIGGVIGGIGSLLTVGSVLHEIIDPDD